MAKQGEHGSDYIVRLRPLRSDVPAPVRLRRFLKAALRVYELRCVEVAEARVAEGRDNAAAGQLDGLLGGPGKDGA